MPWSRQLVYCDWVTINFVPFWTLQGLEQQIRGQNWAELGRSHQNGSSRQEKGQKRPKEHQNSRKRCGEASESPKW